MNQVQLSHHILPNASTMLGVCLTGIGLVKVAEAHLGPSHVDEYLALDAVCFLIIPCSRHNPKILWVDDAEIIGHQITASSPALGDFLAQEIVRGVRELS